MINKKLLLSLLIVFVFLVAGYADKNFVAVLNGSNTVTSSNSKSSAFVGQSVSYNTEENLDYISRSAFASIIRRVESSDIGFENETEQKTFTDINVPVRVRVYSKDPAKKINKIKYKISQGANAWEDEIVFMDKGGSGTESEVYFDQVIAFTKGYTVNYVSVYAQLNDGTNARFNDITINLSPDLSDVIKFTSPDRLTKLASLDPIVETTDYSISLTTTTISLYNGAFASGTPLYEVTLSTETNTIYKMYDTEKGKISYLHSDFIKIYNQEKGTSLPTTLTNNAEYTLKIVTAGHEDEPDTLTFKALGGGVADVLTYPSPFNPKKEKIKIRYLLAKDSVVTIKIYDKAGKFVSKVIQSEYRSAGTNEDEWDGKNYAGDSLATGPYICEVVAKGSNGENRRYTAFALVN